MCLIIDRPEGIDIPADLIRRGLVNNPDGWGLAWKPPGKSGLAVSQGLMAQDCYRAVQQAGAAPLTLHFRLATHGQVSLENCHPFEFSAGGSDFALFHNGILDMPVLDKNRSDTWHFATYVLAPLLSGRPDLFGSQELESVLSSLIGRCNKLVLVREDGEKLIVNQDQGTDYHGLWLSNGYSLPKAPGAVVSSGGSQWSRSLSAWRDYELEDEDEDLEPVQWTDSPRGPIQKQPSAPPDTDDDSREVWSLEDLKNLSLSNLSDLCSAEPDWIAQLIADHLDWFCD